MSPFFVHVFLKNTFNFAIFQFFTTMQIHTIIFSLFSTFQIKHPMNAYTYLNHICYLLHMMIDAKLCGNWCSLFLVGLPETAVRQCVFHTMEHYSSSPHNQIHMNPSLTQHLSLYQMDYHNILPILYNLCM
jgi:hypothetical protein